MLNDVILLFMLSCSEGIKHNVYIHIISMLNHIILH